MKNFAKIVGIILIICLLFCACVKNEVIEYSYYNANEQKTTFEKKTEKFTGKLEPQLILNAVAKNQTLPQNLLVESFEIISGYDTRIELGLSAGLNEFLEELSATGKYVVLACLVNSFLENYNADGIKLSTGGQEIVGCQGFIGKFSFEVPKEPEVIVTPEPTPTPGPTHQPGKKIVALTFDDGPHTKYTKLIVDKLAEYNASATFFIVGNRVVDKNGEVEQACADAIKYAVDKGNEVEIHAYTHQHYYNKCDDATYTNELEKTAQIIEQYTGKAPKYMRPVGGSITNQRVKDCKYAVVIWNCDSEDWKNKSIPGDQAQIDKIVNNVMSTVKNRGIILMHEIYENSYLAFCEIMKQLYAQGYEVTSVSGLFGDGNVKPGIKYSTAN